MPLKHTTSTNLNTELFGEMGTQIEGPTPFGNVSLGKVSLGSHTRTKGQ